VRAVLAGDVLVNGGPTRRLVAALVSRAPAPTPLVGALTPRETEVPELVAAGRSNAEIAQELFLGETTVKTHVGRLLARLGVRDRVGLVIAAYEAGVVRPGQDG
jgi:DNA-binding NarL/FixJ family response regulator